jgi:hypothetical protein
MLFNPHHYDLTLVIVDFQTREKLKTDQEEFKICNTLVIMLNQNHCVVNKLKVCYSPWNQMRDHSLNMPCPVGLAEDQGQGIYHKIK